MINNISFTNFKALSRLAVSLDRLTVFIGPNASGKTSILEGIHYVSRAITTDPSSIFDSSRRPHQLCGRNPDEWCRIEIGVGVIARFQFELWPDSVLQASNRQSLTSDGWQIIQLNGGGDWACRRQVKSTHPQHRYDWTSLNHVDHETREFLEESGDAAFLRFEPSRLAAPSYIAQVTPQVESNGDGLASTLLHLKANDEVAFSAVEDALCEIVPVVRKIRFSRSKVYKKETDFLERNGQRIPVVSEREFTGDVLEFDTTSGKNIPAHLMSEGTLLLLGILTVFHSPSRPRIVLIDDLDRALHPKAQRTLVGLLHRLLDRHENLQIAATTHSPYLLDALGPEQVRLTTLDEDGDVVCAPLNRHPDFPKWKDEMSPGEFWSAVGEDWVREQAKAGAAS